jgi:hypothetical protein
MLLQHIAQEHNCGQSKIVGVALILLPQSLAENAEKAAEAFRVPRRPTHNSYRKPLTMQTARLRFMNKAALCRPFRRRA